MPRSSPSSNHHLWRNGRFWWVAFSVLHEGWRQERVRRSLGTADLLEARRRRDVVLADYARRPGCALAVRVPPGVSAGAMPGVSRAGVAPAQRSLESGTP